MYIELSITLLLLTGNNQQWFRFSTIGKCLNSKLIGALWSHLKGFQDIFWQALKINFIFRTVRDLQKSCKSSTESSHILSIHLPLLLASYITVVDLLTVHELTQICFCLKSILHSDLLSFYLRSFFWLQDPIQDITLLSPVSLSSYWL